MAEVRCAIYTRKSSEEGLEQSFNSLDAQREACAAYILSQCHEGWSLIPTFYDDGGFSGGNMDRPGLKALLADVQAGKVDVIVVYKVDRLTRSLADFAKMVEILDRSNVSFVSITQAFNTTTSMGRLTLNVLLSFAQFEREVTSERIRDKFAASKKKGIWMGGPLPLGYDVKDRKLIVNEPEAITVRHIFARYIALGSAEALVEELARDGYRTKRQKTIGGNPFCRGGIRHMMSNRIYLGEICHKGTCYPGEHKAIVPKALWDKAQHVRAQNNHQWTQGRRRSQVSFLSALIRDHLDRHVYATHAVKRGIRYRYYVTHPMDVAATNEPAVRFSASTLEDVVIEQLTALFSDRQKLIELVGNLDADALQHLFNDVATALQRLSSTPNMQRTVAETWIKQIRVSHDTMHMDVQLTDSVRHTLSVRLSKVRVGQDVKLTVSPAEVEDCPRNEQLVATLAKAYKIKQAALAAPDKTMDELARAEGLGTAHYKRLLKLGFLAPDIVEAVLNGEQDAPASFKALTKWVDAGVVWEEQASGVIGRVSLTKPPFAALEDAGKT